MMSFSGDSPSSDIITQLCTALIICSTARQTFSNRSLRRPASTSSMQTQSQQQLGSDHLQQLTTSGGSCSCSITPVKQEAIKPKSSNAVFAARSQQQPSVRICPLTSSSSSFCAAASRASRRNTMNSVAYPPRSCSPSTNTPRTPHITRPIMHAATRARCEVRNFSAKRNAHTLTHTHQRAEKKKFAHMPHITHGERTPKSIDKNTQNSQISFMCQGCFASRASSSIPPLSPHLAVLNSFASAVRDDRTRALILILQSAHSSGE